MEYTRVDTKKLTAAIARVVGALRQADEALDDLTVLLTPAARSSLLKPRDGFAAAARTLAKSGDLDDLKAAVGYESEAVLEDLANVEALDEVETLLAKIKQRVDDSSLLWLSEAYGMTLELYGVAKARAKVDARVAKAIEALVAHLASPRLKKG
ncbi:MAG: hypothetical protein U0326_17695 [Polyangiales bacterium]